MVGDTIFYAWQNDTSPDRNRYFIRDALRKALAKLERDDAVEDCPRLDYDTEGVPGTPPIADTIFEKIGKTKLFVADVTFIGTCGEKCIPNPNVMIELGYALRAVSSSRVILLMNTSFGGPEQLPFDLRNRRFPICFHLEDGASKDQKREVMTALVNTLAHAIRTVLKIPEKPTPTRNLKLHISPTRSGQRQFAHVRLFNSGPGPVFVESWWMQWGPNGGKGGHNSVSTVKGRLPIRLEEQDAAELLVEIGDDLENLSGIGVFDGDRQLWLASDDELVVFKHNAITHRLPQTQADDASLRASLATSEVAIAARAVKPSSGPHERLEVLFSNKGNESVPIAKAQLSWTYTPPRQLPSRPGKPTVAEAGGSVSLSPLSRTSEVRPGEEAVYVLDDDMSPCLVELLRGDVRDEDVSVEFITKSGSVWKATMDEIPTVVKSVAQAMLKRLQS